MNMKLQRLFGTGIHTHSATGFAAKRILLQPKKFEYRLGLLPEA